MAQMQIVDRDPQAMSRRARIYIMAGGARHFLIGLTMIAFPWLYSSAAFAPIFYLFGDASIQVWAWTMLGVGLMCLAGAVTRNTNAARAGMVGSAVVTLVLGVGVAFGIANVWIGFSHTIGTDTLRNLITSRPDVFPFALRTVAPPSPFLPLLLLSVTIKDFTMCAQPLRVPLEDRTVRGVAPRCA